MKKVLLSIASLTVYAGSAFAADLSTRKDAVSVVPVSISWSGIYAGINAGYGGNVIDTYNGLPFGFQTGVVGVGGPLAGGQVGYNYQFANNIVLGIETDLDYADITDFNYGNRRNSNFSAYPGFGALGNSSYSRLGLNWLGTTRGRLGYSVGNFLPYLTAGVAYGELSNSISDVDFWSNGIGASVITSSGSNSITQTGWTVGAGAEYMIANSWSIKGEYLYTSLGGITTNVVDTFYPFAQSISSTQITTGSFNVHQLRGGINYHTDWLGSGSPVVAKF